MSEKITPEQAERLLKAIFAKDETEKEPVTPGQEKKLKDAIAADYEDDLADDSYPDTDADKIGYAAYVVTKSLEYISPALQRLYRCEALCKLDTPNIITNNESRMALERLIRAKRNIDEAYNEVLTVYKRTKDYSQPVKGESDNER